ncbi:M56 family metallopeptidase [Aquimarina sp. 2201CG5-10]|uniref:M56 family metallopeptidase n=1 Tax=Aquimarina callyspongiae TaxID=3098150 RepID=UPI002AB57874|nr:M56 family metallopeptidase [Aquimarina sp. 2201CG5-10]MDY8137930.1 M56 family metallopeptidase [Aquimarina sp. 2201CG5-10]
MDYIIHSSALIGLSYIIYRFFLSKETFYHLNRWVLLGLIVLSFTLPFITVPENLSFKSALTQEIVDQPIDAPISTIETTTVVTASDQTLTSDNTASNATSSGITLDWQTILIYTYILGILVFAVHFLIQLGVLLYRILKYPTIEVDDYKIIETDKKHAPYSFWNRIFMNPSQYNPDTYLQILKHEQFHIKGWHSIDMLLVELLVALQWFNPLAWLYRKAIDNNLEYLTDSSMLNIGEDKESYQMNLLKVSTPDMPTGLATSYNQSFLKKRILMMNSKKSTAKSGWKYLIIIPLLALTVFSFNPVKPSMVSGEDPTNPIVNTERPDVISESSSDFTKGVWDAEVGGGKLCIMYRSAEPLKRNFWSITRCYDPSYFEGFPNGDRQKLEVTKDAGTMTYVGQFENKIGDGRYTFAPNTSFTGSLKAYGLNVSNKDLVHCFLTGFDNNYLAYLKNENLNINQDDFEDIIHKALPLDKLKMYRKELTRLGYNNYTMKEISKLNLFDVDIAYISFINKINNQKTSLKKITKAKIHNLSPEFITSYKDNGYGKLTLDDYMKLKIHNVTPDYIASFKKEGYTNISVQEAKNLKIHSVTPKYIQSYKNIGYQSITLKEAKDLKIHNVTPAYINSFKKIGYPNITLREAKKLKIHNVTSDLIKSYKKAGQTNLSLQEAIKLKIHNITPGQVKAGKGYSYNESNSGTSSTSHSGKGSQEEQQTPNDFIKGFKQLGYDNISVDDIIALKIHNVTPEFIKEFNNAGYNNIPLDDVRALKIHNVTPGFIDSFKKSGYKNITLDHAKSLKIHNISPDFASEYVKLGYSNISINKLVSLKIHNVSPDYIREFKKTQFSDLDLDDIMSFKIHNVTPEFVQSFKDIGYSNITADQAKSLRIHNVTPKYVKALKDQDPNISLEQAIRIKIHF